MSSNQHGPRESQRMPLVYRSMKTDQSRRPIIGRSAAKLGVRVHFLNADESPPQPSNLANIDVIVDSAGNVLINGGGMSVAPHWKQLPLFRIPKCLWENGQGSDSYRCFHMGAGSFVDGEVAEGLTLKVDRPGHGSVCPAETVQLALYEEHLARTQDSWQLCES